jgi:hypothetical protein
MVMTSIADVTLPPPKEAEDYYKKRISRTVTAALMLILKAYRASRFSLFPELHARDVEKKSEF